MSSGYLVPTAPRGQVLLPGSCIREPGLLCFRGTSVSSYLCWAGFWKASMLFNPVSWWAGDILCHTSYFWLFTRPWVGHTCLWGSLWGRRVVLHPCPHVGGHSRANVGHSSTAGGPVFGIQFWNPAKCFLLGLRCRVPLSWYTALLWYCCLCAFHVCCEVRSEHRAILIQQIVVASGNFSSKAFPLRILLVLYSL